ncbi:MAG: glycosyltransferase family 2 protein [Spirochaetales bacterium]|nr:glycosyltransferase family 2 protein [Spirochaetales bacterium]
MTDFADIFLFEVLIYIACILLLWIIQSYKHGKEKRLHRWAQNTLTNILGRDTPHTKGIVSTARKRNALLDAWISLSQTILPDQLEKKRFTALATKTALDMYWIRRLRSSSIYTRSRAAYYLGYLETDRSKRALVASLKQEQKESVKLYLIHSLVTLGVSSSLPDIIDTLHGSSDRFIMRVTGLLLDFQSSFIALFPNLETRPEGEICALIVEYARLAPFKNFAAYLKRVFLDLHTDKALRLKAFECLLESYPYTINPSDFLDDPDLHIAQKACSNLANRPGKANALILLQKMRNQNHREHALHSLSLMVKTSNDVFMFLKDRLSTEQDPDQHTLLCRALAARLDYFLLHQQSDKPHIAQDIIHTVLATGQISDIITFLNTNHNATLERFVISILQSAMYSEAPWLMELQSYLSPTILQKIGIPKKPVTQQRTGTKNEYIPRIPLTIILVSIALVLPSFALYSFLQGNTSVRAVLSISFRNFLYAFSFYSMVITSFYLFLTACAYKESRRQTKLTTLKSESFLFTKNMLPSISILAPAFNEEASIIASVESLRHVLYPSVEIIVINDGSKDNTLALLIDHFSLERHEGDHQQALSTQHIRGVYKNPSIPELAVIDKVNGGKADSLNAGINLAQGEYILGIDSDSLLDRKALLSIAAAFIDEEKPVIASGGNILPINGCTINQGAIIDRRVPKQAIPLFQTIEYLRSFLNGRLGWAHLRSLMIISGAFGLFRKEEVVQVRGYLTSSERHGKDTVGEDMELVVRLARRMKDNKKSFRILYNAQATCWTEVPSTFPILRRQRERWQRGLIDILSFHRSMILNPRYGTYGLLGFPYYLLFEVIGPWLEFLGLGVFAASLAAGFVDHSLLILIITSNFLFSFALSITSLYTSERERTLFPLRDKVFLALAALAETIGFRQIVSFYRISGFVSILRKVTGWGTMTRTGFTMKRSKQ